MTEDRMLSIACEYFTLGVFFTAAVGCALVMFIERMIGDIK